MDRASLLAEFPPVGTWLELIRGTDGEFDYDALWAITKKYAPRQILELGTREGTSTRVLRLAAPEAKITTVDIEDCARYVAGYRVDFWHMSAETAFQEWDRGTVDLMFIDVDPHAYQQTLNYLHTWVSRYLDRNGICLLHDTLTSAVGKAVRDWCHDVPHWTFEELGIGNGLGALRFVTDP